MARAERGRAEIERDDRLAALVRRVMALSPRLVDPWEATALVESLGYTDLGVQTELGLTDTRLAGEHVFRRARAAGRSGDRPIAADPALDATVRFGKRLGAYVAIWCVVVLAAAIGGHAGWRWGGGDLVPLVTAAAVADLGLVRLARRFLSAASRPYVDRGAGLAASLRRHHGREIGLAACVSTFAATAGAALVNDPQAGVTLGADTWSPLAAQGFASGGLAVALVNALLLVEFGWPGSVVHAVIPALAIAWLGRSAPAAWPHAWFAPGWLAGAASAAVVSTLAVRSRLGRFGYAYAARALRRQTFAPNVPIEAAPVLSALTLHLQPR